MNTKQTIALVGATGNMGSAIAKALAKTSHKILMVSHRSIRLPSLPDDIGNDNESTHIESANSLTEACWEADIIILAVPYKAEKEIALQIKDVTNTKIVISLSNPLNETYSALLTSPDTSAGEELQKLLPNAKVVKAFNTVFAADFATPVIADKQVDVLMAGNDDVAMEAVAELVKATGFTPIIAGDIATSRILENMTLLLIRLSARYNYNWLAGWKILHN